MQEQNIAVTPSIFRKEDRKKEVAEPPTKGNTSGERFQRSPDVFLGTDVFLGKGLHW